DGLVGTGKTVITRNIAAILAERGFDFDVFQEQPLFHPILQIEYHSFNQWSREVRALWKALVRQDLTFGRVHSSREGTVFNYHGEHWRLPEINYPPRTVSGRKRLAIRRHSRIAGPTRLSPGARSCPPRPVTRFPARPDRNCPDPAHRGARWCP
ncbi:hypothetical protein JXQ70_18185, partial [bacterium]|nr:hypothetical protein [bacterium]